MSIVFNRVQKNPGAGVAVALVLAGLVAVPVSVLAQTPNQSRMHCLANGNSPPEALGDRQGHAISVSEFTCRMEGGPLDGGVGTGTQVYEWEGVKGVGKAGFGVGRSSGGKVVYVNTEITNTLTVTDGKVTGFVATGRGYYPVATGTAQALVGKTYSFITKSTGPGQFTVETTLD